MRLIKNLSKGINSVSDCTGNFKFPEIIILDEPTVGAGSKQIIEIRELISETGKKSILLF